MVFHVLNRGVARMHSFEKPADDQAFEQQFPVAQVRLIAVRPF
jgi:hypothetical protein